MGVGWCWCCVCVCVSCRRLGRFSSVRLSPPFTSLPSAAGRSGGLDSLEEKKEKASKRTPRDGRGQRRHEQQEEEEDNCTKRESTCIPIRIPLCPLPSSFPGSSARLFRDRFRRSRTDGGLVGVETETQPTTRRWPGDEAAPRRADGPTTAPGPVHHVGHQHQQAELTTSAEGLGGPSSSVAWPTGHASGPPSPSRSQATVGSPGVGRRGCNGSLGPRPRARG